MIGNSKTLDRHLKKCEFFDQSNFTWQSTAKSRAKLRPQEPEEISHPIIQAEKEEGETEDNDLLPVVKGGEIQGGVDVDSNAAIPNKRKSIDVFALAAPVQKKPMLIGNYLHRTPAKDEESKFHSDLADFIAENDLDFRLVESFSFRKMILHLRPDIHSHCLNLSADQMESKMACRAAARDKVDLQAVTKHVSQYKGVLPGLSSYKFGDAEQSMMECLFACAGTASAIVSIEPTANKQDGTSLAKEMEQHLQSAKTAFSGMQIGSYCTKDTGGYGKARRIASLRFPFVIFTSDFSHQLDHLFKNLLTHCSVFTTETVEALAAVEFLLSSSKWTTRLTTIENEIYGRSCKLSGPAYSDWRSLQSCLASILRVRLACELVNIRHCHEDDFPAVLSCFGKGEDFWNGAQLAHDIALPLVRSSFLVKANSATMSDVAYVFFAIFQALEGKHEAQVQVENQWRQLETPLYILAFCLDPKYGRFVKPFLIAQNKLRSLFTVDDLSRAAAGYYAMLFLRNHEVKMIRRACKSYLNEIIAGDDGDFDLDDMASRHFTTFWQEQVSLGASTLFDLSPSLEYSFYFALF